MSSISGYFCRQHVYSYNIRTRAIADANRIKWHEYRSVIVAENLRKSWLVCLVFHSDFHIVALIKIH